VRSSRNVLEGLFNECAGRSAARCVGTRRQSSSLGGRHRRSQTNRSRTDLHQQQVPHVCKGRRSCRAVWSPGLSHRLGVWRQVQELHLRFTEPYDLQQLGAPPRSHQQTQVQPQDLCRLVEPLVTIGIRRLQHSARSLSARTRSVRLEKPRRTPAVPLRRPTCRVERLLGRS
jgi:hypothetical protein